MDRDGKDPSDLLDELEEKLQIKSKTLSWPVNMVLILGVYSLYHKHLNLFTPGSQRLDADILTISDLQDPTLDDKVGKQRC